MRVILLIPVVMTIALVGCNRTKKASEPAPAPGGGGNTNTGGVGIVVNPSAALGGGGGGGGVMSGLKAARRTEALSELSQLGKLIEIMYNDLNRMPTAAEITESLKRDAPKILRGINDKAYVLTDTKDHSGLWAYEIGAEQQGGVALIAGVAQRATADEVNRFLPKQPLPPTGNSNARNNPGSTPPVSPAATVTKQEMEDVRLFIDNSSGANGKMPSAQQTYDALVSAKSPAAQLVYSRAITLTGATTRESVWAYESAALQRGGLIAGPNGVETVNAAELNRRLGQ